MAVDRANSLATADEGRDTGIAQADKDQTDAEATAYKSVQDADASPLFESFDTRAITAIAAAASGQISAAAALLGSLFTESLQTTQRMVENVYQNALAAAKSVKAEVDAIAKTATADLLEDAKRSIDWAKSDVLRLIAYVDAEIGQPSDWDPFNGTSLRDAIDSFGDRLNQAEDQRADVLQQASSLLENAESEESSPGPSGAEVAYVLFGDSKFHTEAVYDANGTFVGDHVVLLGWVRRLVPNGSGGMKFARLSNAAVAALKDSVGPSFNAHDWDFQFGGRSNPSLTDGTGVDSTGNPIADLITWYVPAEQLAGPGGLASNLLIAAQVATTITSLADPTPLSDLVSVGVSLAQGNEEEAAIALVGAAIPGGFDKLARLAKNVPADKAAAALVKHGEGLETVGLVMNKAGDNRAAARAVADNTATRTCNAASTCFVAGMPVLMAYAPEAVIAERNDSEPEPSEAAVVGATAVAVGMALSSVRRRVAKPGPRLRSRFANRQDDRDDSEEAPMPEEQPHRFLLTPPPEPVPPFTPAMRRRSEDGSSNPRKSSWVSSALTAAMLACFAIGAWFLAPVFSDRTGDAVASVAPSAARSVTQAIEFVRLGQRVVGTNPLAHETQPASDIRPDRWRTVRLAMHAHGVDYDLAFLRPVDWLSGQQATVGGTIALSMPEMGLDGEATVVAIEPCPPIEPDDGRGRQIVTGTMRHLAANVLDVTLAGEPTPLGVTDTHPFWSVDREQFVVAGELRVGERLHRADGTSAAITRITPRTGPPVLTFNLEIDAEHVYHVGKDGLLVHNSCPGSRKSYEDLLAEAQAKYPNKAGIIENHHVDPKYLGGAKNGEVVPLDAAYHQQITNEFRQRQPYGSGRLSDEERAIIRAKVYEVLPLPGGGETP